MEKKYKITIEKTQGGYYWLAFEKYSNIGNALFETKEDAKSGLKMVLANPSEFLHNYQL